MTGSSCEDIVTELVARDAPVLLIDTCSLLDVIRVPTRDQFGVHDVAAFHTILGRATISPPQVSLVVCEQVLPEFQEHANDVENEIRRELTKTTKLIGAIFDRMRAFTAIQGIPQSIKFDSLGFPEHGRKLADIALKASLVIEDHDNEKIKAYARVQRKAPPAEQAKQSVKDCLITETYLRLSNALANAGFQRNKVFITSNKNDYQQKHPSLHPLLRQEFVAAGLEYAPSWSAARHELDRV